MEQFLVIVVILLLFVVVLGYFNERVTKFTYEIALMLFSVIIGLGCLILGDFFHVEPVEKIVESIESIDLEAFLMEGVLCFMLFAGSCHMKLLNFKKHAKIISLLAIGATLLGAVFYGLLFYGASLVLGLGISLPMCLMFGSITAPTDPIAATSILKKFNLPKQIGFIIEGESLLNDGVGVALFVCFSSIVTAEEGGGFFAVMFRELFGAVAVGLVVSFICFQLFKKTEDAPRRIYTSLLAVSVSYAACEYFGFSGAIASVVCGVMFSAQRNLEANKGNEIELEEFDTFWDILDNLLNSVLYVLLGLSFLHVLQMPKVLLMSVLVIIFNLIGRFGSVGISSLFAGKLPDGYDKLSFTKLLTWGGLRGGLCVALAMSTQSMLPEEIYNIVLGGTYAIVFFTTVVQGMTMTKVYRRIEAKLK
ncbi:MAG: sodium:proton antiporter [Lachnospiraceae bacterium]|nr:sodium:proton antiporter [Lachnospiraceae bacterium]